MLIITYLFCVYSCIVDSSFFAVGMFGDRWQKRYFILNGPKLSYYKKYGVSLNDYYTYYSI